MQCRAKRRDGGDCQRAAIMGGTVCTVHGGNLPSVKRAAAERLKDLQNPAVDSLVDALEATTRQLTRQGHVVEIGPDHANRIRAATAILDRTGLGPSQAVNVNLEQSHRFVALLEELDQPTSVVSIPSEERPERTLPSSALAPSEAHTPRENGPVEPEPDPHQDSEATAE